jgi:hypothetical protein
METLNKIAQYVACWNDKDSNSRLENLQKCFAVNGIYTDPHAPNLLKSVGELNDLITFFRSRLNHQLLLIGTPEVHHNVFRMRCKLENEQGILNNITMFGEVDDAGFISKIVCFIDTKE